MIRFVCHVSEMHEFAHGTTLEHIFDGFDKIISAIGTSTRRVYTHNDTVLEVQISASCFSCKSFRQIDKPGVHCNHMFAYAFTKCTPKSTTQHVSSTQEPLRLKVLISLVDWYNLGVCSPALTYSAITGEYAAAICLTRHISPWVEDYHILLYTR